MYENSTFKTTSSLVFCKESGLAGEKISTQDKFQSLGGLVLCMMYRSYCQENKIVIKKITQTAVINIVFQRIFYIELDVSYASQHTFSKVTVTIFENYIYRKH